MAKVKYTVAEIDFTSKKALADYIREIIIRNKGRRRMHKSDEVFMLEFFNQFHYKAAERLGNETFSHLSVKRSTHKAGRKTGQMCFYTNSYVKKKVRGKYTGETVLKDYMISWKSPLDDADKDPASIIRRHFLSACRDAIRHQTGNFKRYVLNHQQMTNPAYQAGYGFCQLTGKMTAYPDLHVDHIHPNSFLSLVDRWITKNSIDFTTLEFKQSRSGLRLFVDKSLARSWRNFHVNNCQLQLICKEANLSMGGIQEKGLVAIPEQFKDKLDLLNE